ncbi:MAG: M23 family metallopeptidase [Dongiaceae bacterium]
MKPVAEPVVAAVTRALRPGRMMLVSLLLATVAWLSAGTVAAQDAPQFQLPLQCEMGTDCWVLRYFDHDSGPGTRDHECGFLTGDDHRGIDMRVRDFVAMHEGVLVLAAADGVVKATRDGVEDVSVVDNTDSREEISKYGLGNTVIIEHGNGWQSAYGHMLKNSVLVREGDQVTAGQPIGMVGLSGLTTFPHVHFMVKHNNKNVDPFTGEGDAACGDTSGTLWAPDTLATLEYRPAGLLIAGFSDVMPNVKDAEEGVYTRTPPRSDGEVIAFWYHMFGIAKGDREIVRLVGPGERVIAETDRIAEKNRVLAFGFVGDKLNGQRLDPGLYRGEYQVIRSVNGVDEVLIDEIVEISIE